MYFTKVKCCINSSNVFKYMHTRNQKLNIMLTEFVIKKQQANITSTCCKSTKSRPATPTNRVSKRNFYERCVPLGAIFFIDKIWSNQNLPYVKGSPFYPSNNFDTMWKLMNFSAKLLLLWKKFHHDYHGLRDMVSYLNNVAVL